MTTITAFDYPTQKHVRRHGPSGYTSYESFREWLRDEFSFRCVFCLRREIWGPIRASFDIDHIVPRTIAPDRACDYDNLLYVCARCNSVKSDQLVPNPCDVAFGDCIAVHSDGTIISRNEIGEVLIELMRLDDPQDMCFRRLYLETWQSLIAAGNLEAYRAWMRFPDNLRDLSTLKPAANGRPEGIAQSAFARRKRDELAETY